MLSLLLAATLNTFVHSAVFIDSSVQDLAIGSADKISYAFGEPEQPPPQDAFKPLTRWQLTTNVRTLWLRVQFQFAEDLKPGQPFYIEIDEHPDSVRLYREGHYGAPISASGSIFPIGERLINNQRILLAMPAEPGETSTYYIAIQSVLPLSGYLHLFTADGLAKVDHARDIRFSLFFGFMFAVLLFNLLMYRYRRENLYLYYALLQPWYVIFPLWEMGYGHVLFPSLAPWYQVIGIFIGMTSVFMVAVFVLKISGLRKTNPKLANSIFALALLGLASTLVVPAPTPLFGILASSVLILLVYTGILTIRRGDRASRLWTAGVMVMMGSGILFSFTELGVLDLNLSLEHIVAILMGAIIFDSIAFTLSISERVHQNTLQLMDKQLELIRRLEVERQAAEVSNIAKEQFLMNINHELQTPLTAMIGFSDMILERVGEPEKNAAIIKKSALRLTQILKDIVDFSSTKRGTVVISPSEFCVCTLLGEVLELLRPEASRRNIQIRNDCEDGYSAIVRADRARTRQILWNVIGNAVRFTERGEIHVGIKCDPDHVRIWVRDTGRGIDPEMQRQIFAGFTQTDATLRRVQHGIGLGLALSRELAQIQGGDVHLVWSEVDRGSEFEVRVPTPHSVNVAITETTMRASWLQS